MLFLASASPEEAADTGEGKRRPEDQEKLQLSRRSPVSRLRGAAVGFWTLLPPQCRQCHATVGSPSAAAQGDQTRRVYAGDRYCGCRRADKKRASSFAG